MMAPPAATATAPLSPLAAAAAAAMPSSHTATSSTSTSSSKIASTKNTGTNMQQRQQMKKMLRNHHPHRYELYAPAPTSFLLSAALLLLDSPLLPPPSSPDDAHDMGAGAGAGAPSVATASTAGTSGSHHHQEQSDPDQDQYVYLIPQSYLQRWVNWSYVQPLPSHEFGRTKLALCMACGLYGLVLPPTATATADDSDIGKRVAALSMASDGGRSRGSKDQRNLLDDDVDDDDEMSGSGVEAVYPPPGPAPTPPGPIDSTCLSVPHHPLLLRGNVCVANDYGNNEYGNDDNNGNDGAAEKAIAVPERFYDLLRSTHGVVTNDSVTKSVSFQRPHHHRTSSSSNGSSSNSRGRGQRISGISSSHGAMGGTVADYDGVIVHHHVFGDDNDGNGNDGNNVCSSQPQSGDAKGCEVCALVRGQGRQRLANGGGGGGGSSSSSSLGGAALESSSTIVVGSPQPVEFRRRVIITRHQRNRAPSTPPSAWRASSKKLGSTSVSVEVHPIRISYTIVAPNDGTSDGTTATAPPPPAPHGFALVSSRTSAYAALRSVLRAALPAKSTESKRIWYPSGGVHSQKSSDKPTQRGDGYDVLDFDSLIPTATNNKTKNAANTGKGGSKVPDAASLAVRAITSGRAGTASADATAATNATPAERPISLSDWIQLHTHLSITPTSVSGSISTVHLLIEARRTPIASPQSSSVVMPAWSRTSLELSNRLAPGDFVDAQDGTRTWYEAQIREVEDDKVKVHYFGWASRWDGWIRRYPSQKNASGEDITPPPNGCLRGVSPPAPLHSRIRPWRKLVAVGDEVEVREVGSLPSRPRWYRGIVSYIAPEDTISEITGGAELEQFGVTNADGTLHPFLLLNRPQQVLVEVEQELIKQSNPVQPISLPDDDETSKGKLPQAQPPHLRWVSLYGEEICQLGTHIKKDPWTKGSKPATITYACDQSKGPVTVLKSANDMHGQGFIRESIRGMPPAPGCVGLQNLGNSCFMNSIVQCLNQVDVLTKYFLRGHWRKELNRENPLSSGGLVATAYSGLLSDIWCGDFCALAPRTLKKTIGIFAPQFNNIHQHDSQEFCGFLMDGLHEDLNRVKEKPYVEDLECRGMPDKKAALESWRRHLLRHDSIIVDHCQGMYRSHVTCPQCGRESVKFDVFSTIPLPLARDKDGESVPLEDCLEELTMGEQLDQDNAFYCVGCKEHVCALKMIALWSVPDILILQIKRFTYNHCDVSKGIVRTKLEDVVKFPVDTLDLRNNVLGPYDPAAPPVYQLFGVSEHSGVTANSGHYTATVRNSIDSHWYRFNDSHVGATTGEASVTGGAYLLFYQRKKGSSKWGGMESLMKNGGIDPHGAADEDIDGFKQVKKKKKKRSPRKFAC